MSYSQNVENIYWFYVETMQVSITGVAALQFLCITKQWGFHSRQAAKFRNPCYYLLLLFQFTPQMEVILNLDNLISEKNSQINLHLNFKSPEYPFQIEVYNFLFRSIRFNSVNTNGELYTAIKSLFLYTHQVQWSASQKSFKREYTTKLQ